MHGKLRTWIAAQPLDIKSYKNTHNDWLTSPEGCVWFLLRGETLIFENLESSFVASYSTHVFSAVALFLFAKIIHSPPAMSTDHYEYFYMILCPVVEPQSMF
jgi:hypothetical protein